MNGERQGAWVNSKESDGNESVQPSQIVGDARSRQRLINLGQPTSSIDSGGTIRFTRDSMIIIRSAGGGASLRQAADYSVTSKAIGYTIDRAIATVPGEGTRDFPVRSPCPHTEACRMTGNTLNCVAGTWCWACGPLIPPRSRPADDSLLPVPSVRVPASPEFTPLNDGDP